MLFAYNFGVYSVCRKSSCFWFGKCYRKVVWKTPKAKNIFLFNLDFHIEDKTKNVFPFNAFNRFSQIVLCYLIATQLSAIKTQILITPCGTEHKSNKTLLYETIFFLVETSITFRTMKYKMCNFYPLIFES